MEGDIEFPDPATNQLRRRAVRRLTFIMHRRSLQQPDARVELSRISCASGVDKRCRIDLKAEPGLTVTIISMARDWKSALATALSRARRTLLGEVQAPKPVFRQFMRGRYMPAAAVITRFNAPVQKSLR